MPPRYLMLGLVALAAACGRRVGVAHSPAGPLGDAAIRLNAAGEAPSWSARVRPGTLSLAVGDGSPLQVKAGVEGRGKTGARWSGALPGAAGELALEVSQQPCHDSETGLSYPLTAAATMQGRRYAGCAAPPGQGLGPRR